MDYRFKPMSKGIDRGIDGFSQEGLRIRFIPQPRCKQCGRFLKILSDEQVNKLALYRDLRLRLCRNCKSKFGYVNQRSR